MPPDRREPPRALRCAYGRATVHSMRRHRVVSHADPVLVARRLFPRRALSNSRGRSSPSTPRARRSPCKHGDIKGFMPGMTMPFKVSDGRVAHGAQARRADQATLVVTNSTGRLEDVVASVRRRCQPMRPKRRRRRRWRPGRRSPTRASSIRIGPRAAAVRLARQDTGRHVRVHALSTPRLLPAHGPQFRRRPESLVSDQRRWPQSTSCP